jgi:hypothetical protein
MVIRIAPVLANTIGDWSVIWQCKCGVYIIELGECPRVAADVIWICGIWACMARTKGTVEVDVHLVLALPLWSWSMSSKSTRTMVASEASVMKTEM